MAEHDLHNGGHPRHHDKIANIENTHLSYLLPYGSLILVSSIIFILLLSNVYERWLLRSFYGSIYQSLCKGENERRRRSFAYFHVGATVMILLLLLAGYPVIYFLAGSAHFSTPMGVKGLTIGDALFIASEAYCGYYLFELCFRTQFASPISIAHHIGLLIITQSALALFAHLPYHREATIEFYMCMVWGTFDIVVEIPIYISMIIWRAKRDHHVLLSRLTLGLTIWAVTMALFELSLTIYLMNRSWDRWPLTWRIVTPLIFALWISTQLYGATRLWSMHMSEKRKCSKETPTESDMASV